MLVRCLSSDAAFSRDCRSRLSVVVRPVYLMVSARIRA
jgi:hypothetical protein